MLRWMSGETRRNRIENTTVRESYGSTYSMVKKKIQVVWTCRENTNR